MGPEVILLILVISIGVILASILIPVSIYNKKYRNFVAEHSDSLKRLKTINDSYHFNDIKPLDLGHSYDNETYYNMISTRDYLIYHLAYSQKKVIKSINDAQANEELLKQYTEEIKAKCKLGMFDVPELLPNKNKLLRTERKMFGKAMKLPVTAFSINVYLELTNINGSHKEEKQRRFYSPEIMKLIERINNKNGHYYADTEIWDAICRVERGKVSNKLRFAIYDRDGWCCRKCGRRTKDLEIDHIVPIAKGGKTTIDNLQTLCHRCNVKKGTDIRYY